MRRRASPSRLRHKVLSFVRERALWKPGDRVAVAVSGGLDSVCLLDLLWVTQRAHGADLCVSTIDHGTRPDAPEDVAFVEALAKDRHLSVFSAHLDLPSEASEAQMRAARYAVWEALDVDRVALAHHRDDQAETVLLHMLRGAGVRGLKGMRPQRERWVRPLLGVRRQELRAWAEERGLSWREDPTNGDERFLRNALRRTVLPTLEALRPGATVALARSAANAAEEDEALDAWAATLAIEGEQAPLSVEMLAALPRPLVARLLARRVEGWEPELFEPVFRLIQSGRGEAVDAGGRRFWVEAETLTWGAKRP